MRCVHGPCIAALHDWVILIVTGCGHVSLFACALLLALNHLVYAFSCIDSDVHSCFEV